jgi:molybdopterin/thiamine biosynthesis adenylyltransferase
MSSNHLLDTRRHMELFDADKFDTPITVIGAGASASWLVSMLARLGITDITVWDFDKVEEHNVPNQAFGIKQVGMYKVDALKENILRDTGLEIKTVCDKFTNQRLAGYVFCMIDTMSGRKEIWEKSVKMKSAIKLYIEPRMGLDVGRVYNVEPMNLTHIKAYEDTFYTDKEAEVSACGTSMSVVTTATSIAAWCVRQLINNEAKEELDNEILIDFKYNNLIVSRW